MWIKGIQVRNYKSFADSGWLEFGQKFNFIVGKNNSGKTALLESLRLGGNTAMPHRDLSIGKNTVVPERSTFEVLVKLSPMEVFNAFQYLNQSIQIPVRPRGDPIPINIVADIFTESGVEIRSRYLSGGGYEQATYPSHGLFPYKDSLGQSYFSVQPATNRKDYTVSEIINGPQDNINAIFDQSKLRGKIFFFEAERIRNGQVAFDVSGEINSIASNLPRALFEMQRRPVLWDTFNKFVNEILPNVRRIVNVGVGQAIQTQLWTVDPSSDRDDLVVKLSDSGSGVGQVLAILCAILTYDQAVICIDEPGNFLHPGAVKALMRILLQYDHQYIISTHSVEAISAVRADVVYMVEWEDGISKANRIVAGDMDDNRRLLADIGVSISDVFGVESIIWVEGQTEEICLPMIVQHAMGRMPSNLAILRVRSVDEIIRRQGKEKAILYIYNRLSEAGGIIPRSARFIFDREQRTLEYMTEVVRNSGGLIAFLPRRSYENYLLDERALAEELSEERAKVGAPPVQQSEVEHWITTNASRFRVKGAAKGSPAWTSAVDAAKLLAGLFQAIAQVEYRKTHHSPALTRRLLARGDDSLAELVTFCREQIGRS